MQDALVDTLRLVSGQPRLSVRFLSEEETLAQKARALQHIAGVRPAFEWDPDATPDIETMLAGIEAQCPSDGALFGPEDHVTGAAVVDLRIIAANAVALWRAFEAQVDILFVDLEGDSGLCLGLEYWDADGQDRPDGVMQLWVWGRYSLAT